MDTQTFSRRSQGLSVPLRDEITGNGAVPGLGRKAARTGLRGFLARPLVRAAALIALLATSLAAARPFEFMPKHEPEPLSLDQPESDWREGDLAYLELEEVGVASGTIDLDDLAYLELDPDPVELDAPRVRRKRDRASASSSARSNEAASSSSSASASSGASRRGMCQRHAGQARIDGKLDICDLQPTLDEIERSVDWSRLGYVTYDIDIDLSTGRITRAKPRMPTEAPVTEAITSARFPVRPGLTGSQRVTYTFRPRTPRKWNHSKYYY